MSKIVIDIGHFNSDSGATNKVAREVDLNKIIADECVRQLTRHGVEVVVSSGSLQDRVKIEHDAKPDYFVSIHNNAGGGDGTEVLVYSKSNPQLALAQNIENECLKLNNSRGIKERKDLYVLKNTKCPAIIIECAFIDSIDYECIDTVVEQQAFGVAIAKGILKTLGVEYKEEKKDDGTRYRICVGSFSDKTNADKMVKELESKGYKPFLVTYKIE